MKSKEYTSSNGVEMIEGDTLNWQKYSYYEDKEEPFILYMAVGKPSKMYGVNYHYDKDFVTIFENDYDSENSMSFSCKNIEEAERLVVSFVDANEDFEILPLYRK